MNIAGPFENVLDFHAGQRCPIAGNLKEAIDSSRRPPRYPEFRNYGVANPQKEGTKKCTQRRRAASRSDIGRDFTFRGKLRSGCCESASEDSRYARVFGITLFYFANEG
jgi:hypothetical protein